MVLLAGAFVFLADWDQIGTSFFNPEIAAEMFPVILTTAAKNTV